MLSLPHWGFVNKASASFDYLINVRSDDINSQNCISEVLEFLKISRQASFNKCPILIAQLFFIGTVCERMYLRETEKVRIRINLTNEISPKRVDGHWALSVFRFVVTQYVHDFNWLNGEPGSIHVHNECSFTPITVVLVTWKHITRPTYIPASLYN